MLVLFTSLSFLFLLWLCRPDAACMCLSIHMQIEKTPSLFSLLTSEWVPQKISPASSPLCLTSLFHHSAAISQLLWPCLVTVHLTHGGIQPGGPQVQINRSGRKRIVIWLCFYNIHYIKATSEAHGLNNMPFCELGSVFSGYWLQFLLHANAHTMFAVSQRESGAKCFSYATAQQTQLSSVVRQEKSNQGAPRVLIKTRLGTHMASEKQTWSRLEAKQQSEAAQIPFRSYWKIPPVTDQELHQCGFTEHRNSAHLCQG